MPSKAKGTHAYRGSQLPVDVPATSTGTSIPPPPSTPFDIPSSSSSINVSSSSLPLRPFDVPGLSSSSASPLNMPSGSSPSFKRKGSSLSISVQSSASSKRRKSARSERETDREKELKFLGTIESTIDKYSTAAPAAYTRQVEAVKRFAESQERSKADGDEWLSVLERGRVFELFRHDESLAEFYLVLVESLGDSAVDLRSWVCNEILHRGADT